MSFLRKLFGTTGTEKARSQLRATTIGAGPPPTRSSDVPDPSLASGDRSAVREIETMGADALLVALKGADIEVRKAAASRLGQIGDRNIRMKRNLEMLWDNVGEWRG